MQFKNILFIATGMATLITSGIACDPATQDCCWGGGRGGLDGCKRQHKDFIAGLLGPNACDNGADLQAQFCSKHGVTEAQVSTR
ncbi:hypothetical protein BP6252_11185 [Coleophoma cylindrospora]|uniref:Extracellular membrane protein CFEM domain-containing protein n=1 Tax=Coleophoma cylindrospora TaxID=1849047 RepID=A0A3D8QPS6_9HELO|nr:hypothetical protein BP6252_11185 [Coleophoma cylindrospora]